MNEKNRDALADALYRASYGTNDGLRQTAMPHFEETAKKLIQSDAVLVPKILDGTDARDVVQASVANLNSKLLIDADGAVRTLIRIARG